MEGYLTINEVAERLGISSRTVRRRIKEGTIPAELRAGNYGQQYFIPASFINTAQEITDVIEVKRKHDVQTLTTAISGIMEAQNQELKEELSAIRAELASTRELLEQLQPKPKKSLLERIFNKNREG